MEWIFEDSLNGAVNMVREQLELAKAQGYSVQVRKYLLSIRIH
jgi:hypothetical protein